MDASYFLLSIIMALIMIFFTLQLIPKALIPWQKTSVLKLSFFLVLSSGIQMYLPVPLRLPIAFLSLFFIFFTIFKLNIHQAFSGTIFVFLFIMLSDSITTYVIMPPIRFTKMFEDQYPLLYFLHAISVFLTSAVLLLLLKKRIHRSLVSKAILKKRQITIPLLSIFLLIILTLSISIAIWVKVENTSEFGHYIIFAFVSALIAIGILLTYFSYKYLIRENEIKALSMRLNALESSMGNAKGNYCFEKSVEFDLMHTDVGKKLTDGYRIEKLIYKGNNSQIYLLRDGINSEHYSLKAIEKTSEINYCFEEISKIKHPKIVGIKNYFEGRNYHFVLKPFASGHTLLEQVQKFGIFSEKKALQIALEIIDALNYLHTRNEPIVFRDLKPSNIIITPNDEILLIDIESVRKKKKNSDSDTFVVGTKGYASPEQYGYSQSTPKSDIYSLGATLYYLLCGKPPCVQSIHALKTENCDWQHSSKVLYLIKKCLNFNPDERFESVEEMKDFIKSLNF